MTNNDHYCLFAVVRRTLVRKPNGMAWIERCKCGRTISADCTFFVGDSIFPKIRKAWFDAEGNLERVTGDQETKT